jgi:hypothetical protein
MHMRPIPITCSRCRRSLGGPRAEERRIRFDGVAHELCAECWKALDEWMGQGARVRGADSAAA